MPTLDNYAFADTPHERTIQPAGYRYGCSSARTGDDKPRGGQTRYIAHPWSANAGRLIVTDWLPRSCCHSERATDAACEGCANQHRPPA
jgi:hypothetical protein